MVAEGSRAPDGSVFADSRLEDACIHLDSCAECGGKVLVSGLGGLICGIYQIRRRGKRHRLAGWKKQTQGEADPSYYKYLEEQEVRQEYMDFLAQFSGSRLVDGTLLGKWNGLVHGSGRQGGGETDEERLYSAGKNGEKTERANPAALVDSPRLRKKLEDYDYLIQHFFTIHPTASIDRSLMNAETFLSMDLTIRKDEADGPQILIYHTHSQENYRDYAGSDGKGAVVSLGEELAKRLRRKDIRSGTIQLPMI